MNAVSTSARNANPGTFLGRAIRSSMGMKFVMAVTGIAMLGFLVGHLAGNLQVFGGPEGINAYAAFLKGSPGILWTSRIGLLVALGLHVWAGVRLSRINHAARPQAYAVKKNLASSWYARYMLVSGTIILAFLIFHILHFTTGTIFPEQFAFQDPMERHDVFRMMVLGFQNPYVAVFYVVAMALLFFHLGHGIWSMTQSLGFWGPRFTPAMMKIGVAIAIILAVGFATMPIAILGGALSAQVEQGGAQP